MNGLQTFRQKYPDYDDMSDAELLDNLYTKHYSDMPRAEFDTKMMGGPPSLGADLAKSAGSGLAQGAVELPGFIGDMDNLARAAGGWVGNRLRNLTGYESVEPPERLTKGIVPDSQDMLEATGFRGSRFDYEPYTDAGKVAKSATRMVPGMVAMGPGKGLVGVATNTGLGLGAGAGNELGGQLAERVAPPLEPYARLAGSALGLVGAKKMITPHPSTAAREAAYQSLKKEGVKSITPGQRTGDPRLLRREAQTGGAKIDAMRANQLEEFTAATLRRVGEKATRATPEVLNRAHKRIGSVFDDVSQGRTIRVNNQTRDTIRNAVLEYESLTGTPAAVVRQYADRVAKLVGPTRSLTGAQYQKLVSDLGRTISKTASNPELRDALWEVRNALDDALARSVPRAVSERLKVARQQYRDLLAVDQAATTAHAQQTAGLLTPAAVRGATIAKQGRKNFALGKDGFSDLTRAGDEILNMPNTSGTAENIRAQGLPLISGRAGAEGAGIGFLASGDPTVAAVTGLIGGVLPKVASATSLSKAGRAYFGNQLLGPASRFSPVVGPLVASKTLSGPERPLELTVNPVYRPAN